MSRLLHYWSIDMVSLALIAGLGLLYGVLSHSRLQSGVGLYAAALLLIGLVQASPLHFLGTHYLFSAHMLGHILLLLVCAPLLVLGLPHEAQGSVVTMLKPVSIGLQKRPWLGWLIGVGVMWFWHVPVVYEATLSHDANTAGIPLCTLAGASADPWVNGLHLLHPVSLLLAGICFTWPVLGPLPSYRIQPLTGVLYLFTACVGCSLLGMLITFAPVGMYPAYAGYDYSGIGNLIRQEWGIDRAADQQMAGLLMWVPGCFIYLSGVMYLIRQWLLSDVTPVPTRSANFI